MKRKELKALAEKIAKCEKIVQNSIDETIVRKAQDEIMDLSGRVESLEDITIIDEMVQEILEKS